MSYKAPAIFILGGAIITTTAAVMYTNAKGFLSRAIEADAYVVNAEYAEDVTTLTYRFQHEGTQHSVTKSVSLGKYAISTGDTITILFDPNDPTASTPRKPHQLTGTPICFGAIGVPVLVIGLFVAYAIHKSNRMATRQRQELQP